MFKKIVQILSLYVSMKKKTGSIKDNQNGYHWEKSSIIEWWDLVDARRCTKYNQEINDAANKQMNARILMYKKIGTGNNERFSWVAFIEYNCLDLNIWIFL